MAQPVIPLATAWQSARLVYRTVEDNDEDKAHLTACNDGDPIGMAFSSPRLLAPGTKATAETLLGWLNHAYLRVFICLPPAQEQNGEAIAEPKKQKPLPTPIGTLFLWPMAPNTSHHRNATLGIALQPSFRDRGYGQEALNWALDWAFMRAGLHRVSLRVYNVNPRALRAYKKVGFVEEGRERESALLERRWVDVIVMGILEHEWEKLRKFDF